jgi:hypothetical protein
VIESATSVRSPTPTVASAASRPTAHGMRALGVFDDHRDCAGLELSGQRAQS